MNTKITLTLLVALLFQTIGHTTNYKNNDKLYVVAFSGLTMRDAPNTKGNKVHKLETGQAIQVVDTYDFPDKNKATIEDFEGHWVYITTATGQKGYVFDAFLSQFPVATSLDILSKNNQDIAAILEGGLPKVLKEYAERHIGIAGESLYYYNGSDGEGAHGFDFQPLHNGHLLIHHGYYEGHATELELYNPRVSEVYYLVKHLLTLLPNTGLDINEKQLKMIPEGHLFYGIDREGYIQFIRKHSYDERPMKVSVFFTFPCC